MQNDDVFCQPLGGSTADLVPHKNGVCGSNCTHIGDNSIEAQVNSDGVIEHLMNLKNALSGSSEGYVCSHAAHSHSPSHENDPDTQSATDFAMKLDQMGEYFAAVTGLSVWSTLFNAVIPTTRQSKVLYPIELKASNDLHLSPLNLALSAALVIFSAIGAGHCHLKLAEHPRLQKMLLDSMDHFPSNPETHSFKKVLIDKTEITLDPRNFGLISGSEAPAFSARDLRYLVGDILAHFAEYVGLWFLVIALEIENPTMRLWLSVCAGLIAAVACIPESVTCINTLRDINAFKNYQIIDASKEKNAIYDYYYHKLILFSVVGKGIPAWLASGLNFSAIALGNYPVGFSVGTLTTLAYAYGQYVINVNSNSSGTAHVHDTHDSSVMNAESCLLKRLSAWMEKDTLNSLKKTTVSDRLVLVGTSLATSAERSEIFPYVLFLCLAKMNQKIQSTISASFLVLLMLTTWAIIRNTATHLHTFNAKKSGDGFGCANVIALFNPCFKKIDKMRETIVGVDLASQLGEPLVVNGSQESYKV